MARAATTVDVFGAIGEPRRREIIGMLSRGAMVVGDIAAAVRLPQPSVSKHLAVLKKVGVVSLERRGRTRVYRLEARELRVVYDWAGQFEKYWGQQIGRIKERAEKAESMQQ